MAQGPASTINVGHIDDVQDLLTQGESFHLPERFVRDPTERPDLEKAVTRTVEIPAIDLSKLAKASGDEFSNELYRLMKACQEWGFFQVVNHGIDLELLEKAEKVAMDFFNLPLENKKKYSLKPGDIQGYGQAFIFSEDQKLDWISVYALGVIPDAIRNPNLWPTELSDFSETVETYTREIRKLFKNLFKYLALTLGLKEDVFEELFGVAAQGIRMNYYPPCPRPDLVIGLSSHSDASALTLLQQKKGCPSCLQILKDNEWVSVQLLENALLINIGDTLEVLTNGIYKSVEHRAVADKEKERLTIVTFYAPSYDIKLGPLKELVDDEKNPSKFRNYNHEDYKNNFVSQKLQGKNQLEFAKKVEG